VLLLLQVKVLWVVNAVEKNWEKQLPSEVRKWLDNARSKKGGLYAKPGAAEDEEKTTDGKGKLLAELWLKSLLHQNCLAMSFGACCGIVWQKHVYNGCACKPLTARTCAFLLAGCAELHSSM
jgi:hypothetical protein